MNSEQENKGYEIQSDELKVMLTEVFKSVIPDLLLLLKEDLEEPTEEAEKSQLNRVPSGLPNPITENNEIIIQQTYVTQDKKIIDYYNRLCEEGKLSSRLAQLIQQDAYGEFKDIDDVHDMTTEDKINTICSTLAKLAGVLSKEQKINQSTIAIQKQVVKKINVIGKTVINQNNAINSVQTILEASGVVSPHLASNFTDNLNQ